MHLCVNRLYAHGVSRADGGGVGGGLCAGAGELVTVEQSFEPATQGGVPNGGGVTNRPVVVGTGGAGVHATGNSAQTGHA